MAQAEIRKYLQENGEATLQEIVENSEVSNNSAIRAINQMEKFKEVKRKKRSNHRGQKVSIFRLREEKITS